MNELKQLKEALIQLTKTVDTEGLVSLARINKVIDSELERLKK